MVRLDHNFIGIEHTNRLGFSIENPSYIPLEYLDQGQFIIFRTCHSYGDWVILSAMPRLIKNKYANSKIVVPSPECLSNYFSPTNWQNKHENPFNNVLEVFVNNPYVDGMIDEIPNGIPVYHDHFRIYDDKNPDVPLIKQMLKFWRFSEEEMHDCEPELYWSDDEIAEGENIIQSIFKTEDFGFLYIDDSFFYSIKMEESEIQRRRDLIQREINNHQLPWLYFSGSHEFCYITSNRIVDVRNIRMSLRVQNYIKTKAKVIIGHQGGYGTDCMSRYSKCFVVPLTPNGLNEHIQLKTTYLY